MLSFVFELVLLLLHIVRRAVSWLRWRLPSSLIQQNRRSGGTNPRLSNPVTQVKASYDVVVVGSGYGAGVAASRMARASPKQSVCVLERGLERWPGEYPDSLTTAIPNIRFTGNFGRFGFDLGRKTGLYYWIVGKASTVFCGNGLGGTSLLNAGVFLRPTPEVMKAKQWPEDIRQEGSLDKYFERAERMLQPRIYPKSFPRLRKYEVLRKQAKAVGLEDKCYPVPLMTAFTTHENSAGVKLHASTLSGQGSMGLNDGSKNTVLTSYLADAWSWGAEIYCGCEVQHVSKNPSGGYNVHYRDLNNPKLDLWVHARHFVFLGAGSIGTTEIMLRSGEHGLPVSSRVGEGMSGNGSMLAFGYDLNERVNSLGQRYPLANPPGPTISGTIDCRQQDRVDDGFLIQEGAFPTIMASLFRLVHWMLPSRSPRRCWSLCTERAVSWLSGRDALQYSQVYLALGHDHPVGKMTLRKDLPHLDMTGVANNEQRTTVKDILIKMTHVFGGTFKEDGLKACVHPLGGMGMSADGTGACGATKHTGEVFSGDKDEVHAGLIVVDGALVPRSLGANPVATITALAERAVEFAADRKGLTIDYISKKQFEKVYSEFLERPGTVTFAETMRGIAVSDGEKYSLVLIMHIAVHRDNDTYTGHVTGHVQCPLLSPDSLRIQHGTFIPFQTNIEKSTTWNMVYDLSLLGSSEETFRFHGIKTITPAIAFSPIRAWRATTTMEAEIRAEDGHEVAKSVVTISATDFLRQLRSLMRTKGQRLLFDFLSKFTSQISRFLLLPLAPVQYPSDYRTTLGTNTGPKRQAASLQHITTSDGFKVPLRMYEPTTAFNGEDLLFIPGGAVTHEIYALPTIRQNAIEYFTARGYRCWIVTHRAATIDRASCRESWTAFDARLDIAAALEVIYQHRGNTPVLVIAHCAGTVALASGLLDGTIPPHLVSGIVASQTLLTPLYAPMDEFKARLGLVRYYRWIVGDWYDCHSSPNDVLIQRLINLLLRFHPQTSLAELCNSSVCQRTQLPYGRLWNHANLNDATHSRLHEIFSGTSADGIEHLANMGVKSLLTDRKGKVLVTDQNLESLRNIPVFLLSGGDSQVFRPEATLRTQQLLNKKFGAGAARRKVFEGLGHLDCWMSDECAKPGGVFETVAGELERMRERR